MENLKFIFEKDGVILNEPPMDCGVYFMYVGDYFYCGRSVNIGLRASQHEYDISVLIREYIKDPESVPDYKYLKNVVKKIVENNISILKIKVVETCEREDIIALEQKWLTRSKPSKMNLNLGFIAKPSSGDTKAKNKADRAEKEKKYQEYLKTKIWE